MSSDIFTRSSDNDDPFTTGVEVVVSAADHTLAQPCRGFYVGTGGVVEITTSAGAQLTINAQSGSYHPWRVTTFHNPETTASGIVAGW